MKISKDPAFLFYSSDFLTGTMFMSNEQIGIYIRLLCSQHQHGGLIDKTSFNSLVGSNDIVRLKFIETESGFYNERLAFEMDKRNKKSNNLSQTAKDVWAKRKAEKNTIVLQSYNKRNTKVKENDTNVIRIENETEDININENINKIKKNIIPTFDEVLKHAQSVEPLVDPVSVKYKYHQWVDAGWCTTKNDKPKPIKNWQLTISRCMKYFNKINTTFTAPKINQYYEET